MPLIKSCLARRQYKHLLTVHCIFVIHTLHCVCSNYKRLQCCHLTRFQKKWDKFIPLRLGQSLFHSKEEMPYGLHNNILRARIARVNVHEEAAATHRSESGSLSSFPHIYILSFPVLFKFVLFHSFILGGTSKTAFESSNSFLSSSPFFTAKQSK